MPHPLARFPNLANSCVKVVIGFTINAHRILCSTTFSSYFQVIWGEATNFGVSLTCFLRVCIVFVIWVFFGLSETSCVRSLSGFVRDGFQRKIGANFANFQAFVLIRGRSRYSSERAPEVVGGHIHDCPLTKSGDQSKTPFGLLKTMFFSRRRVCRDASTLWAVSNVVLCFYHTSVLLSGLVGDSRKVFCFSLIKWITSTCENNAFLRIGAEIRYYQLHKVFYDDVVLFRRSGSQFFSLCCLYLSRQCYKGIRASIWEVATQNQSI